MSTTFANSIDSNPIYADRAENDKDGNRIDTTYAKLSDIPTVPVTDVEVNGTSVVSSGVASVTVPTATSDLQNDSGFITSSDIPVTDVTVNGSSVVSSGTAAVVVPTATSDLQNDSGFITLSDVPAQQQADWTESDSSDPSYIAHKPNLAAVATSGSYLDLSNKPTINNVPAVTSSDDDKVLKASYTGGVGSYSWEDAESGGSYIAGDGISIDQSNIVSVRIKNDYDNALKFTQSQGGGGYAYLQTPEGTPSSEGWQALPDIGYITYSYDDLSDETSFEFTYLWDSTGQNPLGMNNIYGVDNLHYDAKIHLLYISSKEGYTDIVATSNTVSDAFTAARYSGGSVCVYSLGSIVDTTGDVYKLQVNFTVPGDVGGIFNALAVSSSGTNYFGTTDTVQSSFLNETHVLAMQGSEVFIVAGEPVPGGYLYVQVDQTYDPISAFPQSGYAVDEAINSVRQVPYSDISDEGKVLTVDSNGDPTWATGGGGSTYTAGNGIDITNNVVSVDTSVVATQTDLSGKQDTLTAGTNVSITNNVISATDTTYTAGDGIDITNNEISVEAPVDIVAGPGIVIDNPDGNTMRVTNIGFPISETDAVRCGTFKNDPMFMKTYTFTGTVGTSETTINMTIDEKKDTDNVNRIWIDPSTSFILYGSAGNIFLPLSWRLGSGRQGSVGVLGASAGTLSCRCVDTSSTPLTFNITIRYTVSNP